MTSPRLPAPSLDLSRVKALLFDVDGTLADSDDVMVARVARSLHRAFPYQRRKPGASRENW